jgi:hypothetical protein
MDKAEARLIMERRVAEARQQPYAGLRDKWLGQPDCEQVTGAGGVVYQVEIEGVWDDRKAEHLRLVVSIDDGGWRAFAPLTDSFIVAPDGSFVGE